MRTTGARWGRTEHCRHLRIAPPTPIRVERNRLTQLFPSRRRAQTCMEKKQTLQPTALVALAGGKFWRNVHCSCKTCSVLEGWHAEHVVKLILRHATCGVLPIEMAASGQTSHIPRAWNHVGREEEGEKGGTKITPKHTTCSCHQNAPPPSPVKVPAHRCWDVLRLSPVHPPLSSHNESENAS